MNLDHIFEEIAAERKRQHEKWGEQNHLMRGKSLKNNRRKYPTDDFLSDFLLQCEGRNKTDKCGWFDILMEEVCEAFLETDPKKQRAEMIQVTAVAVQIIEYLDRRIHDD